ncbi:MAG: hypothetical protein ACTS10_09720 [Kiloniellales bacterium]
MSRRAAAALVAIFLLLYGGVLFLTAGIAAEERAQLQARQFSYVLSRLVTQIESSLSLGLTLDSQRLLAAELSRVRARDERILSIDIFAEDGRLVFTTEVGGIRQRVPEAWLDRTLDLVQRLDPLLSAQNTGIGAPVWREGATDANAIGVALTNAFGAVAGGIVLRFQDRAAAGGERILPGALSVAGLLLLALAVGVPGVVALLRPLRRSAQAGLVRLRGGAASEEPLPEVETIAAVNEAIRLRFSEGDTRLKEIDANTR